MDLLGDLYSQSDLLRDSNNKIYVNADGNVAVNDKADDIYLGSVFPKANMAWRNDFQYGNWGLGFLLTARLGGVVFTLRLKPFLTPMVYPKLQQQLVIMVES